MNKEKYNSKDKLKVIERSGIIQFKGKDVTVVGKDIVVGQTAPDFSATDQNWEKVNILEHTKGKVRIIASVPSLETSICDRETRKFNEEAISLDENIHIIVISTDLPYTQEKWCGAAGIERVLVVSDHLSVEFGEKYGCLMREPRVLRRAVFIVDQNDMIVYARYMENLGDEPNYGEVIREARDLISIK